MKGNGPEGCAGKSCKDLTHRSGAGENVPLLVDQMELVAAVCSRYSREAFFQVGFLERNQHEPFFSILPVDPPGEAASKPSTAVVDDCGLGGV